MIPSVNVAASPQWDIIAGVNLRRPGWLKNWLQRHQHPVSRWLHLLGIPLTVAAGLLAGLQLYRWQWDLWWRPVTLLVVGYLLQAVGHRLEGNDMGEMILVKKLLRRPYRAISSRQAPSGGDHS